MASTDEQPKSLTKALHALDIQARISSRFKVAGMGSCIGFLGSRGSIPCLSNPLRPIKDQPDGLILSLGVRASIMGARASKMGVRARTIEGW